MGVSNLMGVPNHHFLTLGFFRKNPRVRKWWFKKGLEPPVILKPPFKRNLFVGKLDFQLGSLYSYFRCKSTAHQNPIMWWPCPSLRLRLWHGWKRVALDTAAWPERWLWFGRLLEASCGNDLNFQSKNIEWPPRAPRDPAKSLLHKLLVAVSNRLSKTLWVGSWLFQEFATCPEHKIERILFLVVRNIVQEDLDAGLLDDIYEWDILISSMLTLIKNSKCFFRPTLANPSRCFKCLGKVHGFLSIFCWNFDHFNLLGSLLDPLSGCLCQPTSQFWSERPQQATGNKESR